MEFSRKPKREYVLTALEKFEQYLTRYAARLLGGNTDLAADAVQFTFMKLCEQNKQRPENQLKAWLFTVCRNRIIDEVRKRKRQSSIEPEQLEQTVGRATNPSQAMEEQEYLTLLKCQVQQMPIADREIIDLWSNGFKHNEIAEITSQKPGTVRVQLHRAIKVLKQKMVDLEPTRSQVQR